MVLHRATGDAFLELYLVKDVNEVEEVALIISGMERC